MPITHLGLAAVLVEEDDRRILIDPGSFADGWHGTTDLDAILITHQHADHADPENLPALLDANPDAAVYVEPSVIDALGLERAVPLGADTSIDLGSVTVAAVGGLHAVIHRDIPQIGNVGLVFTAEGEPTFFHPGDSLTAVPAGIDVLGVPLLGPWAALKETVDFVRAVDAPRGFGIHDALLSERGHQLYSTMLGKLTEIELFDLRGAQHWEPPSA